MHMRTQRRAALLTALWLTAALFGCAAQADVPTVPAESVTEPAPQATPSAEEPIGEAPEQTPPPPRESKLPEPLPTAEPSPPPAEASSEPVGSNGPEPEVSPQEVVPEPPAPPEESPPPQESLEEEAVALSQSPAAVPMEATAVASGVLTKENAEAVIDYSNTGDGYVMVQYTAHTDSRLKAQVKGPSTAYTYNLTAGQWAALPLSDGNGTYQIVVYKNVSGTKYAAVLALTAEVLLADEFAPFLHSNQYVNFDAAPQTAARAAALTGGIPDTLGKVEAVYDYVVEYLTYDKELAATVKSGYLPDLDRVLEKGKGICFDYAALMTGMLRSRGVPCKLVVGYAGEVYHAWISVWTEHSGWVDGVIWFDGSKWQRMDPTFASSGERSESILAYIGNGSNYSAKYFY